MLSTKRRLIRWGMAIGILLLIPLLATIISSEFNWDLTDFLVLGVVLSGIGLTYELIAQKSGSLQYRGAFALGLLGAFLLFWVNGAVGIIGYEGQDANLLFGLVFGVGIAGALISGFKARGMSRTLYLAATLQMLVPLIALLIWPPSAISWSPGVFAVFLISGFFAFIFALSGMLFSRASKEETL
jgi:hypothetical protein